MKPYTWTLSQVLTATGGSLSSGSAEMGFAGIGIDSRTIEANQLFVAIAGESHDGHRFVAAALDRGVKGVLVAGDRTAMLSMQRIATEGIACIVVDDTTRALGALARFNRNRGELKVLAITGSNGKTSTRMLTGRVIAKQFSNLSTMGNQNNHIGLPLTLLRLGPEHHTAILELGMNHAGEIDRLGRICEPDVGVITNVGPVHLEGLGSIENVARAKAELLPTIRAGGMAILNADDSYLLAMAAGLERSILFFGIDRRAAVRADQIQLTDAGTAFTLTTPSGSLPVTLATPSRVMVSNALAAAAVGEVMGVPLDLIKAGLESFSPPDGRMGIRMPGRDIRLVDDTYNANPVSMAAAIETLARMRGERRTIVVIGDMLELGPQAEDLHRRIGRAVAEAGIDRLFVAGSFADAVADGAMAYQMSAKRVFTGSKTEIVEQLNRHLKPGDLILVKGSRGMAMEEVADAIARWAENT